MRYLIFESVGYFVENAQISHHLKKFDKLFSDYVLRYYFGAKEKKYENCDVHKNLFGVVMQNSISVLPLPLKIIFITFVTRSICIAIITFKISLYYLVDMYYTNY